MISLSFGFLLATGMTLAVEVDPTSKPVFICKFTAGEIVIEPPDPSGKVTVEVDGKAREYVMDKLKLVPRDQGLPSYQFQPDLKRWQLLNVAGEPTESTTCIEKPALKTG